MPNVNEISPVEFGKMMGHLEAIRAELREIKDRHVWRLDDLEKRVEGLENKHSKGTTWRAIGDRTIFVVVGAILISALKMIGIV